MHFIHSGSGSPSLVFVHGFACAHDDWDAQIAHFSGKHAILACDLRGHGATPGRAGECTIANFGGDVAALVANFDIKDAVLVGHSMGCRVVLEAARLDPARIGGIVLVDGSMNGGNPALAEAALRQLRSAPSFAAFANGLFGGMFLEESAVSRAIIERAKALPADVGTSVYESLVRWDVEHMRDALSAVRAPLLAVQSTVITPERKRVSIQAGQTTPWLDLVRAMVPGASIELITGAGHFPQIERADVINRLIGTFVGSLVR